LDGYVERVRKLISVDSSDKGTAQLEKLHDQAEVFIRKIEAEKRQIEELDLNIKELDASVMDQRKKLGGANAVREDSIRTQKQIKILENRLEKSLLKFNEALAFNKQLRVTGVSVYQNMLSVCIVRLCV
jgi:predicted  nucleic acid-binding Zn-ribbon protein